MLALTCPKSSGDPCCEHVTRITRSTLKLLYHDRSELPFRAENIVQLMQLLDEPPDQCRLQVNQLVEQHSLHSVRDEIMPYALQLIPKSRHQQEIVAGIVALIQKELPEGITFRPIPEPERDPETGKLKLDPAKRRRSHAGIFHPHPPPPPCPPLYRDIQLPFDCHLLMILVSPSEFQKESLHEAH